MLDHMIIPINKLDVYRFLETKLEPVCAGDDRAGKYEKQYCQDHTTAAAGARTPPTKTKRILQPVKQPR